MKNRSEIWNRLQADWDLIIVGGGITGAAVFRRAVSGGYKALLVDKNDFSSGTSSRSSKLVHGGFRYLKNKQYDITRESVREREWLLKAAPHLVTKLGFILPYSSNKKDRAMFRIGTAIYDLMAPKWDHSHFSREKTLKAVPQLENDWMEGSYLYHDAAVDDSRLVLRLIGESVADGGVALNYTSVLNLLRDANGQVSGVKVSDQSGQGLGEQELRARVIINATGVWSDKLRAEVGGTAHMRPLRGSHLIFAREKLPINYAVTIMHPKDKRAMFAIPWEGTVMVGTTDLDHANDLDAGEPYCTQEEITYILEAANHNFPKAHLGEADILSSFAGIRPIVRGAADKPSGESRRHAVWEESGMITVTGGKLTICRKMAEDALAMALPLLGKKIVPISRWFKALPASPGRSGLDADSFAYLAGRYGTELSHMLETISKTDLDKIGALPNRWFELRQACRTGMVEHLDDLLLRRVRLGILLPDGAKTELPRVKEIVTQELGWDESKWTAELERYNHIYNAFYAPKPAVQ